MRLERGERGRVRGVREGQGRKVGREEGGRGEGKQE